MRWYENPELGYSFQVSRTIPSKTPIQEVDDHSPAANTNEEEAFSMATIKDKLPFLNQVSPDIAKQFQKILGDSSESSERIRQEKVDQISFGQYPGSLNGGGNIIEGR